MYLHLDNQQPKTFGPVVDRKTLGESIAKLRTTSTIEMPREVIDDTSKTDGTLEKVVDSDKDKSTKTNKEKTALRPPSVPPNKPVTDQLQKPDSKKTQQSLLRRNEQDKTPPASSGETSNIPPQIPKRISSTSQSGVVERATPVRPQKQNAQEVPKGSVSTSPVNVGTLTMEDVCDWLDKLNLGRYRDTFLDNMVDGVILLSMDGEMLREEFEMTRFEAMKLMKFAKSGHVPKRRE